MSRRARRERPATAAEQRQVERFAELAAAAISGPPGQRADAVRRMTRVADQLRDPDRLANVPTRDLLDAIRERFPDDPGRPTPSRVLTHQKTDYGAPKADTPPPDFRPVRGSVSTPSTSTPQGAT